MAAEPIGNKEQTDDEFLAFLTETLIPDLKVSGNVETAADFERCAAMIKERNMRINVAVTLLTGKAPGG